MLRKVVPPGKQENICAMKLVRREIETNSHCNMIFGKAEEYPIADQRPTR
jgi:hypothetical protein